MGIPNAAKEMKKLQRRQDRIMRDAANEVVKKRPKESSPGGNPNPYVLTLPKRRYKI